MHYLQAVILGIVQGITEFLPISSTAHLIIVEKIFKLDQSVYGLSFDMFTNLGTLAAAILYFRRDLIDIFGKLRLPIGKPLDEDEKLPWVIILATIPVGLLGLLLEERIATDFRSLYVIIFSLIIVGLLMMAAERFDKQPDRREKPTLLQTLWISLSQCIAFLPGVSRSGITISTGMFLKLDRVTAARYSFMLSVPIILAATLLRLVKFASSLFQGSVSFDVFLFYLIAAFFAYLAGWLSIDFLMRFYRKNSLSIFAYYRFALALILLISIKWIGV